MLRKLRFLLGLMVVVSFVFQPAAVISPARAAAVPAQGRGQPVLQFTAGKHVLGFQPGGVYLAAATHALHISFIGANLVQPVSSAPAEAGGQAQALQSVSYRDLWPGIDLTYQAAAESIAESTYQVAAGARLDQIRLAYNQPAALNPDGSLAVAFSSGKMTESAPVAWQEIGGQRQPVAVAFKIEQSGQATTVGFTAAGYNPAYPLTIDPFYAWLDFLGGTSDESNNAIAADWGGNVYLGGDCSMNFGSPKRAFFGLYRWLRHKAQFQRGAAVVHVPRWQRL